MTKHIAFILLLGMAVTATSCRNKTQAPTDTVSSGVIKISVDESFRPLIQEEIDVYEGLYPAAGLIPEYTSEVEAINLLLKDSVRLTVSTRRLTEAEINGLQEKKLFPKEIKIATDGIALITHKQNADTILSVPDLTKILTGKITQWSELDPKSKLGKIQVVFDNSNSSTIRYVIDSLCKGQPLYQGLTALGTNPQVIDYVAKTPNALGVIGVSWIGNKADSTNLSFSERINVMRISRENPALVANSCKPFQAYLALGRYPLTRDVYIILTEPRSGLASGFTTYICSDRGQRILLKSGVVPATQAIRLVDVRDEL